LVKTDENAGFLHASDLSGALVKEAPEYALRVRVSLFGE